MPVYDEMFAWSATRPLWQRDALRRLISAPFGEQDMVEILGICLNDVGLRIPGVPVIEATSLSDAHVPSSLGLLGKVTIKSMREIYHVNLLGCTSELSVSPIGMKSPTAASCGVSERSDRIAPESAFGQNW